MSDKPIQSGWYALHGETAYCEVSRDSDLISVSYANGSYTACNLETFREWGAEPAPVPSQNRAEGK